jgi:hypothetical protein
MTDNQSEILFISIWTALWLSLALGWAVEFEGVM